MKHLACAFIFILAGCAATGDKVSTLREGMSKDEVIQILGQPDGYQKSGDAEALRYVNRRMNTWKDGMTDYTVVLQQGKLTEYGPGQIRLPNTGAFVLMPFR